MTARTATPARVTFVPTEEGAADLAVIAPPGGGATLTSQLHRAVKLMRVVLEHQRVGGTVVLKKRGQADKEVIFL